MPSQQKNAVVTGAGSGIGLATAERLACEGHHVVMADIRPAGEQARRVQQQADAAGHGGLARAAALDIADAGAVEAFFKALGAEHGRLDILVNNAGIDRRGILERVSIEEIDAVLGVNLRGTILVARAAMPLLRAAQGTIVNVASELGMIGAPGLPVYVATKGGVVALTRALAVDHAADGIRVNCVCPGATLTPLLQESIDSAPDPEARRRLLDCTTLMRRVGRPEEIANVIRFLASSEASFMTGAIVPVDGGATAAWRRTRWRTR